MINDGMMQNNNTKNQRVAISKENFKELVNNRQFISIVRLGRILNSILFSMNITVNTKGDTPADTRQTTTAFLYMCSLLYESFQDGRKYKCVYNELKGEFASYESFKQGFLKLYNNPDRKKLHKSLFEKTRNKILFHFDSVVITEGLERYMSDNIEFDNFEFCQRGHSTEIGDFGGLHFTLSDEIVICYFKNIFKLTDTDFNTWLREITEKVAILAMEFVRSADTLMADVLNSMGWKIKNY